VKNGKVTNGTKDTINHAKRANKKVVIISWYIYIYIYVYEWSYKWKVN
jgi:ribosomal protein L30E